MEWITWVQITGGTIAALGGLAAAAFANYARTRLEKLQMSLELSKEVCQERIADYKELWQLVGQVSSAQFRKSGRSLELSAVSEMLEDLEEWYGSNGYHLDPFTRDVLLGFRHRCRIALKSGQQTNKAKVEWEQGGKEIWELKTQLRMCIARSLSSPKIGLYQGFRRCPFSKRQLHKWLRRDWRLIEDEM